MAAVADEQAGYEQVDEAKRKPPGEDRKVAIVERDHVAAESGRRRREKIADAGLGVVHRAFGTGATALRASVKPIRATSAWR